MNNKERKVIYEFKQLLDRVPAGHTGLGTKSVSLEGVVGAHQDFIEVRVATRLFLTALMNASTPFEDETPEQVLRAFEAWFADRAAAKWQPKLTDFFSYYLDHTRVNGT